jgi:segregation and condensation protein B
MRYQYPVSGWEWPPPPALVGVWRGPCRSGRDEVVRVGSGQTVRSPRMADVEAVLFLAQEPMPSRKIAQLANLADGTEARTLVGALNRMYDSEGCAFHAVEVAGGFQLMSRSEFAPWLRRLDCWPAEVRLSAPAIETLAVVAYRQPVLRAEIESIRGVQCGEILRQLMERDLVRIAGRSEELGRPFLYGTTRRFLQIFGLRHLDELPQPELVRPPVPDQPTTVAADGDRCHRDNKLPNRATISQLTEEELNVKTSLELTVAPDEILDEASIVAVGKLRNLAPRGDDEDLEDEELEDEDDELDDEDEDEDEELEEEDDVEEEEWEEVPEEDEEEDKEEEEEEEEEEEWDDEDEDWDEDEDEDWDDEDEDWEDDDEDEDWEEEEESEEK